MLPALPVFFFLNSLLSFFSKRIDPFLISDWSIKTKQRKEKKRWPRSDRSSIEPKGWEKSFEEKEKLSLNYMTNLWNINRIDLRSLTQFFIEVHIIVDKFYWENQLTIYSWKLIEKLSSGQLDRPCAFNSISIISEVLVSGLNYFKLLLKLVPFINHFV